MNAEALIGTVLGTCTLQRLIGQGGMGAVYLAQQSRPKRQVAVKVLLPMTPLSPNQLAAFLERFRRETDAAASLEHPNITPVHEYGERDGLAYLVMPYISGGTLRDEMEREGPLPLASVLNYLEQMAAALDFAHERGVIHRDIKPANILMTPEGRLLLTDFGLVKIVAEGQAPQIRLTGAGAPVGTPDYMAPEQVIGEDIDARADLYSLGVVLYQMVTGTTPFQGETPMQIAAQHLQIPPPSPQMLRPDLPITTEQVMLRSLAKRPSDRYTSAQELANAFRVSLLGTGIALGLNPSQGSLLNVMTGPRIPATPGLLDNAWQSGKVPAVSAWDKGNGGQYGGQYNGTGALPTFGGTGLLKGTGLLPAVNRGTDASGVLPTVTNSTPRVGGGLLSRTGKFPQVGTGLLTPMAPESAPPSTGSLPTTGSSTQLTTRTPTGALQTQGLPGPSNTVKLTGPVKVVQVPVVGQPGRFVTGILPVLHQAQDDEKKKKKAVNPWMKVVAAVIAVLLVVMGTVGTVMFLRSHPRQAATLGMPITSGAPNTKATAAARATAAAQSNVILFDRLDHNINNWLTNPPDVYAFKDGAYHITDRENSGRATVLQSGNFSGTLGYTLTMQEVAGDDASPNNSFGMIFRFTQKTTGNKTQTTFYSFEVVNTKGGQYQFWKYDDSQGTNNAWHEIWHADTGKEYHQGHGPQAANTIKIFMHNNNFTFTVNGNAVKTAQDNSLKSGTVGMIVNLNKTEVAFKNLLLTRN
jgi:serine/threonine protein kinase